MSMGYGGAARIIAQNEKAVVYEYSPYNLNDPKYRNIDRIYDGLITISKDALAEAEIHEKLKRMPNGRKKHVVKRIRCSVDYKVLFDTGKITVKNSCNSWSFVGPEKNYCMIAVQLVFKIFDLYQDKGSLPEKVSINY